MKKALLVLALLLGVGVRVSADEPAAPAAPLDTNTTEAVRIGPLKGIKSFVVECSGGKLDNGSVVEGFDRKALQTMVEKEVKSAECAVATGNTVENLKLPVLVVEVECLKTGSGSIVYTVDTYVMDYVKLCRDAAIQAFTETWDKVSFGICPEKAFNRTVRDIALNQTDALMKDYLVANPKDEQKQPGSSDGSDTGF